MNSSTGSLADHLRRVINRLIFLEKRSIFRQGVLRLHPSEIHLMQVIKELPGLSAGDMAQKLGVSNGAVSQTLARLERKGVVRKEKDRSLKNRLTVDFTEPGRDAIERFEEEQASAMASFSEYLSGLTTEEHSAIGDFLSHLEEFVQRLE
ncbi:MAG: MarR family transcriptional regulator [Thermodesulfobacteriota bacterium]